MDVVTAKKKKIALIVPSTESMTFYRQHISRYEGFTFLHYTSLDEFNNDASNIGGCDGFIVDLRAILKSDSSEKEYINYILDLFPSIRITHTPDKKSITGHVKGRTLKDLALFDYFFMELFPGMSVQEEHRIVLIVNNEASKALYNSYLKSYGGISLLHYSTPEELQEVISQEGRYNGFIIDLRTMMKSGPGEKDLIHELIDSFPAMRVSHSPDGQNIKGNVTGKNLQNQELFDYFIDDLCKHFTPRGIRTQKRRSIYLNVFLDISGNGGNPDGADAPKRIKANTVDISEGGSFVLGTTDLKVGDTLHMIMNELTDKSPIECTIKWVLPWGESARHLPGFGVSFSQIKAKQRTELMDLFRLKV